jgi:phage baseplate assembly protein V
MTEQLRALIATAIVLGIDDTGQVQTATVQTADGVVRSGIEVVQPFGFASNPPGDGATGIAIAVGGDPANIVVLPPGCAVVRFGGLAKGEAVMYGSDGSRVAIRTGGIVEVRGATAVNVDTGTVTVNAPGGATVNAGGGVTVTAADGVTMNANLHVNGGIVATGDISDQGGSHGTFGALRTAYDTHDHPDPQGGTTGVPNNIV